MAITLKTFMRQADGYIDNLRHATTGARRAFRTARTNDHAHVHPRVSSDSHHPGRTAVRWRLKHWVERAGHIPRARSQVDQVSALVSASDTSEEAAPTGDARGMEETARKGDLATLATQVDTTCRPTAQYPLVDRIAESVVDHGVPTGSRLLPLCELRLESVVRRRARPPPSRYRGVCRLACQASPNLISLHDTHAKTVRGRGERDQDV
jgi:hypothetical protein